MNIFEYDQAKRMGALLRRLREDSFLTLDSAARGMDIGTSTLCGYERGCNIPTLFAARRAARFYSITLDELAAGAPERPCDI